MSSLINKMGDKLIKLITTHFLDKYLEVGCIHFSGGVANISCCNSLRGLPSWLWGRVCGSPTGRLFQVSPAKFKWLGPSPAPQNGKCFCRAANLHESCDCNKQVLPCRQCQQTEVVFSKCTFKLSPQDKKKYT